MDLRTKDGRPRKTGGSFCRVGVLHYDPPHFSSFFMSRFRAFFQSIIASCRDIAFYRTVRKRPLRMCIGYAYALLTLV